MSKAQSVVASDVSRTQTLRLSSMMPLNCWRQFLQFRRTAIFVAIDTSRLLLKLRRRGIFSRRFIGRRISVAKSVEFSLLTSGTQGFVFVRLALNGLKSPFAIDFASKTL